MPGRSARQRARATACTLGKESGWPAGSQRLEAIRASTARTARLFNRDSKWCFGLARRRRPAGAARR
jgi:hypothetical protein